MWRCSWAGDLSECGRRWVLGDGIGVKYSLICNGRWRERIDAPHRELAGDHRAGVANFVRQTPARSATAICSGYDGAIARVRFFHSASTFLRRSQGSAVPLAAVDLQELQAGAVTCLAQQSPQRVRSTLQPQAGLPPLPLSPVYTVFSPGSLGTEETTGCKSFCTWCRHASWNGGAG